MARLTARTTTVSPSGREEIEAAIRQFNVDAGVDIASNVRNFHFVANVRAYSQLLLVLWVSKDQAVNLSLREDIGKFTNRPNLRQIELPEGGHCANFDMPDAFEAALQRDWTNAERLEALVSAENRQYF